MVRDWFLKERSDHCAFLLNFPPLTDLLIEVLLGDPLKGETPLSPCAQGCRRQIGLEVGGIVGVRSAAILTVFGQIAMTSAGKSLENPTTTVLENRGGNRCVSRPANAVLA